MFDITPLTFIAILLLVLVIAVVYSRVVQPYREFCFYKRILTAYKTLVHPFSVVGMGTFAIYKQDYIKYGDSQYTIKRQYPSYQVSLASFKGMTYVDLIDPQLIKEFYERQMEGCYVKTLKSPFTNSLKHLIGNGLIFSEGEEWKMKRKIMSHVFNYDFIKSKIGLIAKICEQKINQVEETQINRNQRQVKIDVGNLFQRIFGSVVGKSFFGDIQLSKIEGEQLFSFVNDIFEKNTTRALSMFAFFAGSNFFKYNLRAIDREVRNKHIKFSNFARNAIQGEIKKRKNIGFSKEDGKYDGVIDYLISQNKLKAQDSNESYQKRDYYTVADLIDEFTTFFTAGIDTTTNSTSMLVYLLAQHPHVQSKLRRQIDEVFPSPFKAEDVTHEKLKNLTYFDDVTKESLRMYGPNAGLIPREAVKDHYIGTIPIRKGLLVGVKVKPNHFKDEFYSNPLEFNPERWSQGDPSKKEQFSFFPFSSGKRNCIGQHLALLESKIAIVFLLKRYAKITLEKPNFKKYMRTLYAPEQMTTTFEKHQ